MYESKLNPDLSDLSLVFEVTDILTFGWISQIKTINFKSHQLVSKPGCTRATLRA